jgi:hypothetical protein
VHSFIHSFIHSFFSFIYACIHSFIPPAYERRYIHTDNRGLSFFLLRPCCPSLRIVFGLGGRSTAGTTRGAMNRGRERACISTASIEKERHRRSWGDPSVLVFVFCIAACPQEGAIKVEQKQGEHAPKTSITSMAAHRIILNGEKRKNNKDTKWGKQKNAKTRQRQLYLPFRLLSFAFDMVCTRDSSACFLHWAFSPPINHHTRNLPVIHKSPQIRFTAPAATTAITLLCGVENEGWTQKGQSTVHPSTTDPHPQNHRITRDRETNTRTRTEPVTRRHNTRLDLHTQIYFLKKKEMSQPFITTPVLAVD